MFTCFSCYSSSTFTKEEIPDLLEKENVEVTYLETKDGQQFDFSSDSLGYRILTKDGVERSYDNNKNQILIDDIAEVDVEEFSWILTSLLTIVALFLGMSVIGGSVLADSN